MILDNDSTSDLDKSNFFKHHNNISVLTINDNVEFSEIDLLLMTYTIDYLIKFKKLP